MEMNLLEMDFLFGLSFQLNVTPTTLYTYFPFIQRQSWLVCPPLSRLQPSTPNNSTPPNLHRCVGGDDSARLLFKSHVTGMLNTEMI